MLGFVVAGYLYNAFPEMPEGELTDLRAALVKGGTLARVAEAIGLGRFMLLGRGEEASGGRTRIRLLSSTLEAVLGAIYLDQGLEAVREFILRWLGPELQRIRREEQTKDPKSRLQEITQAETGQAPAYHTVASEGPDHARVFVVEVRLGQNVLGRGQGASKQEAEQAAARNALATWPGSRREEP